MGCTPSLPKDVKEKVLPASETVADSSPGVGDGGASNAGASPAPADDHKVEETIKTKAKHGKAVIGILFDTVLAHVNCICTGIWCPVTASLSSLTVLPPIDISTTHNNLLVNSINVEKYTLPLPVPYSVMRRLFTHASNLFSLNFD
jgi:hypothetical protein